MAVKIKIAAALDLSVDNEVMNFYGAGVSMLAGFSGVSWTAEGGSELDSLAPVVGLVFELVKNNLPGYGIWLLVGTSSWQPNTNTVRYHKIWKALKAKGISISSMADARERILESDAGLKIFGVAKLTYESSEDAVNVLMHERCAYFVAMPSDVSPDFFLEFGWGGELVEDAQFFDFLKANNALLFKKTGDFDDPERGVFSMGQWGTLSKLVN